FGAPRQSPGGLATCAPRHWHRVCSIATARSDDERGDAMPPATTAAKPKSAARKSAAKPRAVQATLSLSSKNYSSWSLRGWLLARFAGLAFDELMVSPDDADAKKEMLLLSPSILVP